MSSDLEKQVNELTIKLDQLTRAIKIAVYQINQCDNCGSIFDCYDVDAFCDHFKNKVKHQKMQYEHNEIIKEIETIQKNKNSIFSWYTTRFLLEHKNKVEKHKQNCIICF